MGAHLVEPVFGVWVIRLAAMHDPVPKAAVAVVKGLADSMRLIEAVVPEPDASEASVGGLQVGDRLVAKQRVRCQVEEAHSRARIEPSWSEFGQVVAIKPSGDLSILVEAQVSECFGAGGHVAAFKKSTEGECLPPDDMYSKSENTVRRNALASVPSRPQVQRRKLQLTPFDDRTRVAQRRTPDKCAVCTVLLQSRTVHCEHPIRPSCTFLKGDDKRGELSGQWEGLEVR